MKVKINQLKHSIKTLKKDKDTTFWNKICRNKKKPEISSIIDDRSDLSLSNTDIESDESTDSASVS